MDLPVPNLSIPPVESRSLCELINLGFELKHVAVGLDEGTACCCRTLEADSIAIVAWDDLIDGVVLRGSELRLTTGMNLLPSRAGATTVNWETAM